MRKVMLLLVVAAIVAAIGAVASDPVERSEAAPAPPPPTADAAPEPDTADGPTCQYRSAEEIVQEWRAAPRERTAEPPPCPAENQNCSSTNTCAGSNSCGISGFSSDQDTGLQKCRFADGSLLNCTPHGQTVHISTTPCSQCPCCTAQPFSCICPIQCAQVIRVICL